MKEWFLGLTESRIQKSSPEAVLDNDGKEFLVVRRDDSPEHVDINIETVLKKCQGVFVEVLCNCAACTRASRHNKR